MSNPGLQPLYWVSFLNRDKEVIAHINAGDDLNEKDNKGKTPLDHAQATSNADKK